MGNFVELGVLAPVSIKRKILFSAHLASLHGKTLNSDPETDPFKILFDVSLLDESTSNTPSCGF